MRHSPALCCIDPDRPGLVNTKGKKTAKIAIFVRAAGFPQKINGCSRYLGTKIRYRGKMLLLQPSG
jgi:hypothetical protein